MKHMDRCAPDCDDQLPSFAHFGRGPKGDSTYIEISEPDTCDETYLHGWTEDSETKEIKSEWYSRNINGGRLMYYYTARPYTDPRTFTITFKYFRPGHDDCTWSWTTPAIPYIWTLDDAGKPEEYPDHIVGSGIATQYIKTMSEDEWHETLHYPNGTGPEDFNSPKAGDAWSSTIRFGLGGDIEIPDYNELAKIIGVSVDTIRAWLMQRPAIADDAMGNAVNIKDYIDTRDQDLIDHVHSDLGFNQSDHASTGAFGGKDTVKAYIDDKLGKAQDHINNLYALIDDLVAHIYGASVSTVSSNIPVTTIPDNQGKKITWPANDSDGNATKIPMGSINVYSGDDTTTSPAIRTHAGASANNDIKGK